MKQNLPPAKNSRALNVRAMLVLATCVFCISACATPPRSSLFAVENHPDTTKAAATALTNINSARTEELEKLPGVGKVIAERIVAHREQYGPFRRAEHLMMVRGISDNKFRQLRTMIVVE